MGHDDAQHVIGRGATVIGLGAIALIHLIDLPGKFEETPYVGWLYVGLIVACVAVAARLVVRDDRPTWFAVAAISAGTIAAFIVSRTVGLPGASDDIGNWLEPLGLAALFTEAAVVAFAIHAARPRATAAHEDRRDDRIATTV